MNRPSTDVFDLSPENERRLERVFQAAVRQALLEHERAGNPVAIWRDGRVAIVPAAEALGEDSASGAPNDPES